LTVLPILSIRIIDVGELLKIENLKTYFFTEEGVAKAVDGVSLSLQERETLALVGESGCGKSVTALSILRLIPDPPGKIVAGSILFEGINLLELSEKEMRKIRGNKISMIFQEPLTSLNPVFRVGDQIAEVIKLHQQLNKKEAWRKSIEMLKLVGISSPEKRIKDYPHQLSGGMRQRAMIAMALSCHPQLLIADEPTTALDVTIQAQILDLINVLKDELGMALLLITHDLGVVAETAKTVAVMYAGKIVEYADVKELFRNPLHPYTQGLLHSLPRINGDGKEKPRLEAIPGTVPPLLSLPQGCKFSTRCPRVNDRGREAEPPLKKVRANHFVRCWLYHDQYV
jgi:peptide/nickel transport system ATP-binding protein/oligopeptide transport system ATP-binding protein